MLYPWAHAIPPAVSLPCSDTTPLPTTVGQDTPEEIRVHIANADMAVQRGDVEAALATLGEITPQQSYYVQAKQKMAEIYLANRKDKGLYAACYQDLVAENPTGHTYLLLGGCTCRCRCGGSSSECGCGCGFSRKSIVSAARMFVCVCIVCICTRARVLYCMQHLFCQNPEQRTVYIYKHRTAGVREQTDGVCL